MNQYKIPLNVCYIIGSLRVGGAEKQCINVLNTLQSDRKYIILLSSASCEDLSCLLDKGVVVHRISARLRYLPYYIIKLILYIKKENINVVHTHMFWSSVYGVVAAKLARVPVIITSEHGLNPWKHRIHNLIERWLLTPLVSVRICVSNDIMMNRIKEDNIPRHKLTLIPNGTQVKVLNLKRSFPKTIKIIAVGRLVPAKDYITLIKAMEILLESFDKFELTILGDGPLMKKLQSSILNKSLQEYVKLVGNIDNVNQWLEESTIYVMTSVTEGQPMSLLEAMAVGLPIVATNVGGIPETVEEDHEALLVDSKQPHLIAEAILKLINNIEFAQQLGMNASKRVNSDYSIESVCKRLETLYLHELQNN
ncbi:MAG: glycosyltransferase [Methylococcales bacterium]